jgi:hypothetical protein
MDTFTSDGRMEVTKVINLKRGYKGGTELFAELDSRMILIKKLK